jgi:hypothetical protein
MKKLLPILILSLSLLTIASNSLAQTGPITGCTVSTDAQTQVSICSGLGDCTFAVHPNCAVCCLVSAILTLTNWVFWFVMVISSLMVIFGAFTIVTAGGDPGKVGSGRNYILYAMVGFAVGLFSQAIPSIVQTLLGV